MIFSLRSGLREVTSEPWMILKWVEEERRRREKAASESLQRGRTASGRLFFESASDLVRLRRALCLREKKRLSRPILRGRGDRCEEIGD